MGELAGASYNQGAASGKRKVHYVSSMYFPTEYSLLLLPFSYKKDFRVPEDVFE
jgi:hypothetical protein